MIAGGRILKGMKIGEGSFGVVYQGVLVDTGENVAIKTVQNWFVVCPVNIMVYLFLRVLMFSGSHVVRLSPITSRIQNIFTFTRKRCELQRYYYVIIYYSIVKLSVCEWSEWCIFLYLFASVNTLFCHHFDL